jgi:hypothetical protein
MQENEGLFPQKLHFLKDLGEKRERLYEVTLYSLDVILSVTISNNFHLLSTKKFKNLHFLTKNGIFEKTPSKAHVLRGKKSYFFKQFYAVKICIFQTYGKIGAQSLFRPYRF